MEVIGGPLHHKTAFYKKFSKIDQRRVKFREDLHRSGSNGKASKWSFLCLTFKKVPRDSVAKHFSGEVSVLKTGLGIEFERHFCPQHE